MDLIAGFMENYLGLSAKEELEFQNTLDKNPDSKEKQTVMELMTSWERKGRQEGLVAGELAVIKRQLKRRIGSLNPILERPRSLANERKEMTVRCQAD